MNKETGIIFSTPMMIADLANMKFMSRRTWGLNKINENPDDWDLTELRKHHGSAVFYNKRTGNPLSVKCPYGGIGDLIYCKETWRPDNTFKGGGIPRLGIQYGEGVEWKANNPDQSGKWKSSMFMPKWASRRKHILTNIRCERVQGITEEDAIKEGMGILEKQYQASTNSLPIFYVPIYAWFWDVLNKKRGHPYSNNDWVWILEWAE